MRVRILSGHLAGTVQDVPQIEGEVMVATGFGELAATEPTPDEPVDVAAEEPPVETPPDPPDSTE